MSEAFKAWLAVQGIWWDQQAMEISEEVAQGMGVRSLRRIRAGEVLATIPKALSLEINDEEIFNRITNNIYINSNNTVFFIMKNIMVTMTTYLYLCYMLFSQAPQGLGALGTHLRPF